MIDSGELPLIYTVVEKKSNGFRFIDGKIDVFMNILDGKFSLATSADSATNANTQTIHDAADRRSAGHENDTDTSWPINRRRRHSCVAVAHVLQS